MKNESRVHNSIRNAIVGILSQCITIILNFITRSIFIKFLGIEYLGVNGLFTNILTILSLAELGVGGAMVYSMYKPLADNDEKTLQGLMNLYAKAYRGIAIFITIIGFILTPYLHIFIKDNSDINNISLIYLLFLINTVASYLFAYKRSILSADQKEYIVSACRYKVGFVKCILQISFLYITRNFTVYLIIQILCTVLENCFISYKANKMYPYLKNKDKVKIDKEITNGIFTNIKALMIYKICSVMLDGTDSIIISTFVGVSWVGLLSNYTLIIGSVSMIVTQLLNALTASIGNLVAKEDGEKQEFIFNVLLFISFWIYSFGSICLFVLLNPFIELWIGKEYFLSVTTIGVIVLNFYIYGMQSAVWTYRSTMGLFVYGKWRPLISGIINIAVSVILAKWIGLIGVLLGTTITRIITNVWYDPLVIFKHGFRKSVIPYYIKYMNYFIVLIKTTIITLIINRFIIGSGIITFIARMIICAMVPNILMVLIYFKKDEFKYLCNIIRNYISSIIKNIKV